MAYTAKQQRLINYNKIITANKFKLKAGMELTRDEFVNMFGITGIVNHGHYMSIQESNLKLVSVQNEINMLMRENGLYMKSKNYYSKFVVATKDFTKNTIIRYSSEVDRCEAVATRLEARMVTRLQNKNWGLYNKVDNKTIGSIGKFTDSVRHATTKHRVRQF